MIGGVMKGSVMQTTSNNSILVDFYSATNLGDDLLLHALLKRYPNTQFIMLASREERILEMQYDNLKVIELGDKRLQEIRSDRQICSCASIAA